MTARKIWIVLAGALWLCLLGVIASVAVERLRVDHKRLAGAHLEDGDDIGAQVAVSAEWPWEAPVRMVSEALARGDRASAEWAWRNAWGAALGARRWEGMAAGGGPPPPMGGGPRAPRAVPAARVPRRDPRPV